MRPTSDDGTVLNAEYSVVADDGGLALILESAGGRTTTGVARNADYRQALTLLLQRLRDRNAVLRQALVDSNSTRHLTESQRTVLADPVDLAELSDMEALRLRLTVPQGAVGQGPDARKAGNNSKRLRIRLSVPGYGPQDSQRLATDLATRGAVPTRSLAAPPRTSGPVRDALLRQPTAAQQAQFQKRRAGYLADAELRLAIKDHAERWAADDYEDQGYTVENVGDHKSYDLHATKGDVEIHIEVKGSSGTAEDVELTFNEVAHACTAETHLVVVDQIGWSRQPDGTIETHGGRFRRWTAWTPDGDDLRPTRYRYRLPPDDAQCRDQQR